ncbi:MAG: response regulator [Planctomycetota bacterium]
MNDPSSAAISVLIVDDDEVFRERLGEAFRRRGFEVRTAANYDQASATAQVDSPEWAIVDLRMPRSSGLDVVSRLKDIDPSTRVVVLTGYGSIATAVDAMRLGAHDYLSKPADADQLIAALNANGKQEGETPEAPAPSVETPSLARVEWEHIQRVLNDSGGNISEASRRLGIHRRSLQRKLQKCAPS